MKKLFDIINNQLQIKKQLSNTYDSIESQNKKIMNIEKSIKIINNTCNTLTEKCDNFDKHIKEIITPELDISANLFVVLNKKIKELDLVVQLLTIYLNINGKSDISPSIENELYNQTNTKDIKKLSYNDEQKINEILDKLISFGGDITKLEQNDIDYLNNIN